MRAPLRLAALTPEGLRRQGSAGAEVLRSVATRGQPCGARAGCLPCRGCDHIVSGLIGPALARFGRASRVQDLERLRTNMERRCATGVRAGCCQACTASIRGPGIRGELSLASDAHDGADVCLNRAPPLPRKAAQLRVPSAGRGEGSMGEAGGAGISFSLHVIPDAGASCDAEAIRDPAQGVPKAHCRRCLTTSLMLDPGSALTSLAWPG